MDESEFFQMSREGYRQNAAQIHSLVHSRVRGRENRQLTSKRIAAARREIERMRRAAEKRQGHIAGAYWSLVEEMESELYNATAR